MTYQVTHSDSTNPLKPPINVKDGTLNNETSLQFVGRGYPGFAPIVGNNFLHLLENFANITAPENPVEGQLWFDTASKLVKVYDGAVWNEAGAIKKSSQTPDTAGAVAGDLWVNTATSQLYVYSGSSWILVGPQFSEGLRTGPVVEVYTDTDNVDHNVLSFYASSNSDLTDHIIAIVSKDTFTPKLQIDGFPTIYEGMNLSSVNSTNSSLPTRFYGTALAADNLLINNALVQSANFLRKDVPSETNYPLSVSHDGGISVGKSKGFNIAIGTNTTQMLSNTSGSSVDFILNNGVSLASVLHIDPLVRLGIGTNNTTPETTVDIAGTVTIKDDTSYPNINNSTGTVPGKLVIRGTTDSSELGTGSIVTAGGLSVAKRSNFGGDINTNGVITVSGTAATSVIVPDNSNYYDIGSDSNRFRNVYARTFVGAFNGSFTGNLTGSISGKASALQTPTVFSMTGEVMSNEISFNGQSENGQAVFTVTVKEDIITKKTAATDSFLADYFLAYRQGVGLLKMSKKVLTNHVPLVPIGTILPYAGITPPTGYLFCDGSEVLKSQYPDLYTAIGDSYKPTSALLGLNTFGLPDFRSRFPLGRDTMDNRVTVPSKDGSNTLIKTGGGSTARIDDAAAGVLGASAGSKSVLPSTNAVAPTSIVATTVKNSVVLPPSTFSVVDPYQTINYIIFTGVL